MKIPNIKIAPKIKRSFIFIEILKAISSLIKGMRVTLSYLVKPSTVVTQQYPENKPTLKMHERYRAELVMPHDENGFHKCTGCKICHNFCPNMSIVVLQRKNATSKKIEIDKFLWRLDSCTFCNICVMVCPFDAITMSQNFETAAFDRRLYLYNLNQYAGPTASVLSKIEDPEERKKEMEPRGIFEGDYPLNGVAQPGAPVHSMDSYTHNSKLEEK
ncbi:MAG: 4Fe-4S binding protein [Bacteriovoracaceae bacterium]